MRHSQPISMDLKVGGLAAKMVSTNVQMHIRFLAQNLLCRKKKHFQSRGHDGALGEGWIQLRHWHMSDAKFERVAKQRIQGLG
jgi:hypothetical protein